MGSPKTEKPLRADAERNRQRLLDAAEELFTAKGLEVGLDEIARHAGVGVGTAYRRFPDKRDLIWALFERRIDEMTSLADEALAMADPWAGIVHFMYGAVQLHVNNQGLKEIIFGGVDDDDRVLLGRARIAPRATELVRRAQNAGALRADLGVPDIPILQFLLSSLSDVGLPPELWRRYVGIVLDGLRAEAATPLPHPPMSIQDFTAVMRSTGLVRRRR